MRSNEKERVKHFRLIVQRLPVINQTVLRTMFFMFQQIVEHSDQNKMTTSILYTCTGSTITSMDMEAFNTMVKFVETIFAF
jgi:flagellar biosynthesis/type III secretory pathway chaperone